LTVPGTLVLVCDQDDPPWDAPLDADAYVQSKGPSNISNLRRLRGQDGFNDLFLLCAAVGRTRLAVVGVHPVCETALENAVARFRLGLEVQYLKATCAAEAIGALESNIPVTPIPSARVSLAVLSGMVTTSS
jgi:hypothetical protein